jgi:hypothetical protein
MAWWSERRNGTTVFRNRLRSGAAVSGSRWLSSDDASTRTDRERGTFEPAMKRLAPRRTRPPVRSVCRA